MTFQFVEERDFELKVLTRRIEESNKPYNATLTVESSRNCCTLGLGLCRMQLVRQIKKGKKVFGNKVGRSRKLCKIVGAGGEEEKLRPKNSTEGDKKGADEGERRMQQSVRLKTLHNHSSTSTKSLYHTCPTFVSSFPLGT